MSTLSFEPQFESDRLAGLDLPVEVRKTNLAVVAMGRTSQPLQVPAGEYHVIATLPGGQQMHGHAQVAEGDQTVVPLRVDPADAAASPEEEEAAYFWGTPAARTVLEAQGVGPEAKLRLFAGNLLTAQAAPLSASPDSQLGKTSRPRSTGVSEYEIRQPGATLVQLLQPRRPTVNAALPAVSPGDVRVVLAPRPDGAYRLMVQTSQREANSLIRYLEKGQLAQATELSYSPAVDAEQLLGEKAGDPIGAVVGAYALLRLGELARLHDWTADLMNIFPQLPDGLTIRAEHLARTGKHGDALAVLVHLSERGLPMFSDGLSYALNRLGNYVRPHTATRFEHGQVDQAEKLLGTLRSFAPFVDYRRFILTFTGRNPNDPDDVKLDELDYDDQPGLEVSA